MNGKFEKSLFERFLRSQASGSIVLMVAAVTAVIWANSGWSKRYYYLSHLDIGVIFAGKTYQLN